MHTHSLTQTNTYTDLFVHPTLRYEAGCSVHVAAALIRDCEQRRQQRPILGQDARVRKQGWTASAVLRT